MEKNELASNNDDKIEVTSFHEVIVDKEELIAAHWVTLSNEMQIAFTLTSKQKFSEMKADEEILEEFSKFFKHLPLEYIDCVFISSLDAPEKAMSAADQVLNEGS